MISNTFSILSSLLVVFEIGGGGLLARFALYIRWAIFAFP
jgi:hypothetical protein